MPEIRFKKTGKSLSVPRGANLMKSLLEAGVPVASSCYGKGICARCRIDVSIPSDANQLAAGGLSRENPLEKQTRERLSETTQALANSERLSCQTKVLGDIVIDTPYW